MMKLKKIYAKDDTLGVAQKNRALKQEIIKKVDEKERVTISDLNSSLNISTPKVINLVNELIAEGLVLDIGKIESTGGRRASLYGLSPTASYFLGVDVKKDSIHIGMLDFDKNMVRNERIPYHFENTPGGLNNAIDIIQDFIQADENTRDLVNSIVVNLPGRINYLEGSCMSIFHFSDEPLKNILEKKLGTKVFLENDARSMAYGEFLKGIVDKEKSILFVNMDYGLGVGIILNKNIYYGKSGFSGEIGHVPYFDNEIICHCGKRGCLETEASGYAVMRHIKSKMRSGAGSSLKKQKIDLDHMTLEDVVNAAVNDDVLAIEMLANAGEKIGLGIAILVNIFNPELVVLGGTLAASGDLVRLPIQSALNKSSLAMVNNDTNLKMSKLNDDAGIWGGCLLARNKIIYNI